MGIGLLIALAISIVVFAVLFHLIRKIVPLILHGIVGIIVFWVLNLVGILAVPIDLVTFLIAALGGTIGVLVVIVLAYFGVPL